MKNSLDEKDICTELQKESYFANVSVFKKLKYSFLEKKCFAVVYHYNYECLKALQ